MDFSSLINMGYVASDILGAFTKKGGPAAAKIRKAISLGYPAVTILNKLLGGKEKDENFLTLEEKAKSNFDKQKNKAAMKAALTTLGVVGGASALLARGSGAQTAAAVSNLPGPSTTPKIGTSPNQNQPPGSPSPASSQATNNATPTPAQTSIINRIPGSSKPLPTQAPATPIAAQGQSYAQKYAAKQAAAASSAPTQKAAQDLSKDFPQIETFVKKHAEAGKSPEETLRLIKSSKTLSSLANRYEQKTGDDFKNVVDGIYDKTKKPKNTSKKELIDNFNVLKNLMNGLREK